MTAVILLSMVKTLFYLRIFPKLSPIIKMLTSVIKDLQPFMLFFFVLIVKFSLIIGIMGLGNKNLQDSWFAEAFSNTDIYPGSEYIRVGMFFGNIISMFRNAMGDFDSIIKSVYLDDNENVVFWLIFLLFLIVGNIVFLNFVIAEAGNSYNKVKASLEEFIM